MFRTTGVQSAKFIKKKRRKFFIQTAVIAVALSLLLYGASTLSSWNKVTIQNVEVVGNTVVETFDIVELVNSKLDGNYVGLFSKRNLVLYPKKTLERSLLERFERIKKVVIDVNDANTLIVYVTERQPASLWCGVVRLENSSEEECYYMDASAYIFESAPYFSENVYTKYYGLTRELAEKFKNATSTMITPEFLEEDVIGSHYMSLEKHNEIRDFVSKIKKILQAVSFVVTATGEYEVVVKNADESYGTVFVSNEQSFEKTFDNLNAFVVEYKNKNRGNMPSFEYIDTRYGSSIIYKFKQ